MATSTAQLKPADAEADKPAKSKKKLILMVVPALVLLLAGGGYFLLAGGGGGGDGHGGEPPPPTPGAILVLDPTTINLADGHYLKVTLALQMIAGAGGGGHGELDGSQALDLTIATFSGHTVAELSVPANRAKYKKKLLEKLDKAYHHEVMDLYFREFVMQ